MTTDEIPFDRASLRPEGCFLVSADGDRYLDLAGPGGHAPSAYGERLAAAFAEECAANDVRGRLTGGPEVYAIAFEGQEDASPELMRRAFLDELRHAGVLATETLTLTLHPEMDAAAAAFAEEALRHGARRLRTLLVEHNSYLSGGLRYPFPPSAAGVAERGLAIYRFPKTGNVDVTAEGDRIRIAFKPGDVGPITSSGFYLPTLISGDFTVDADYELRGWHPDAVEPGCFALFAQNEDSSHRYYAQRMSSGDGPHRLVASHVDQLSPERAVDGDRGSFRVTRAGDVMTCFHRQPGADWIALGTAPAPPESEMILGAKIWAKLRCGGLCVDIYNLRIDGRLADRQIPPVPVVQDPRSKPPTHP